MKRKNVKKICAAVMASIMVCGNISGCGNNNNSISDGGNSINLTIMGTSDVHNYLMNYDYYTTSESNKNGLVKVSTIIKQYRQESRDKNKADIDNVVVFDNGDLIQGNPLGDYFARVSPVNAGTEHPVYKALEVSGFDAGTLGNHEFNYGLDYLSMIINDSKVPIVNANVYNAETKEPQFKQYDIITKTVADEGGNEREIKIGVTGFVPPQILNWDKINLEGKVEVRDIKETAEEVVPLMKKEGADIIVALAHTGYGDAQYEKNEENEAYELTKIKDINAVIAGHSHDTFPSEKFTEDNPTLENVDVSKGTMNGVPTVQPAKYAEGVGVIELKLSENNGEYTIENSSSKFVSVENVEPDQELVEALKAEHEQVIAYVNSPVGNTTKDINTYFALVNDNNAVQLISDAQLDYLQKKLDEEEELAEYKNFPILSAAAPFKAGLSKDGTKADDYVEIKAGELSIKDIANIYKYPNTAVIMKLNGKDIKNWLEMTAGMFNTIDPNSSEDTELLNTNFAAFNFDTLDGVTYEIDVTVPPKYDAEGNMINENSSRIVNLKYKDEDVAENDEFLVITNNYRASGGGNFPIFTNDDCVIFISSDETRQIISDYVKAKGTINPEADNNWSIKKTPISGRAVFLSNSNGADELGEFKEITLIEDKGGNLSQYQYNMNS